MIPPTIILCHCCSLFLPLHPTHCPPCGYMLLLATVISFLICHGIRRQTGFWRSSEQLEVKVSEDGVIEEDVGEVGERCYLHLDNYLSIYHYEFRELLLYHTGSQPISCKDSLDSQNKEDSKWGLTEEINVEMSVLCCGIMPLHTGLIKR